MRSKLIQGGDPQLLQQRPVVAGDGVLTFPGLGALAQLLRRHVQAWREGLRERGRAACIGDDLIMRAHYAEGYERYPSSVKHFGRLSTHRAGIFSTMAERHDRLRRARVEAGFERQRDVFARHPDWNRNSYKSNENGNAPFSFDTAKVYAKAFNVRAEWLYDGTGGMRAKVQAGLPVVGKVAAGDEGYFEDDYELGGAADFLAPTNDDGDIILIVDGVSMVPRFRPGEKLQFGDRHDDPTPLVGEEVMARLADGRKLLKTLRRGSRPGLFTLYSINSAYEPIEDVELLWALRFKKLHAA